MHTAISHTFPAISSVIKKFNFERDEVEFSNFIQHHPPLEREPDSPIMWVLTTAMHVTRGIPQAVTWKMAIMTLAYLTRNQTMEKKR